MQHDQQHTTIGAQTSQTTGRFREFRRRQYDKRLVNNETRPTLVAPQHDEQQHSSEQPVVANAAEPVQLGAHQLGSLVLDESLLSHRQSAPHAGRLCGRRQPRRGCDAGYTVASNHAS